MEQQAHLSSRTEEYKTAKIKKEGDNKGKGDKKYGQTSSYH
jgi:hypothetical protein